MATKKKYPFELPVLHDYEGDITRRWYIEWKVWNIIEKKLVRQRYWNLNRPKSASERYEIAKKVMSDVSTLLEGGAVLDPDKIVKIGKGHINSVNEVTLNTPFLTAYQKYLKLKNTDWANGYASLNKTIYNRFELYLKKIDKQGITLKKLNTQILDNFSEWLKLNYKVDNNSLAQCYIPILKAVFNYYSIKVKLPVNPTKGMWKPKTRESIKEIYTDEEATEILKYSRKNHPFIYLLINFIFFSCIRPKELLFLKGKHIKDNHILVPGKYTENGITKNLSKNSKTQLVRIFPGLERVIQEYHLRDIPDEDYIFSARDTNGTKRLSRTTLDRKYKPIVDFFALPPDKRLYNWKHTGAVKIYKMTKDIKFLQRHLRHSSVKTTEVYLRSLLLLEDDYKEIDLEIPH